MSTVAAASSFSSHTRTPARVNAKTSYRAQLDYNADRYGLQLEHLLVERGFSPEVGFVRRDDIRRSFASARFSPRPRQARTIRRYSWTGSMTYIENAAGRVEYRDAGADFGLEFQSGDRFGVATGRGLEFVPAPFRIGGSTSVPVADDKAILGSCQTSRAASLFLSRKASTEPRGAMSCDTAMTRGAPAWAAAA